MGEKEKISEALLKVALGYQVAEVTEEYAEVDGALKLTKRKKTKKDVPPDLKAVQMLLASDVREFLRRRHFGFASARLFGGGIYPFLACASHLPSSAKNA